jgi:hypothetical protein
MTTAMSMNKNAMKAETNVNVLTEDELKLVCRAFAAMLPSSFFESSLKLIEDESEVISL